MYEFLPALLSVNITDISKYDVYKPHIPPGKALLEFISTMFISMSMIVFRHIPFVCYDSFSIPPHTGPTGTTSSEKRWTLRVSH